jgi:hypothetical protein
MIPTLKKKIRLIKKYGDRRDTAFLPNFITSTIGLNIYQGIQTKALFYKTVFLSESGLEPKIIFDHSEIRIYNLILISS